LRERGLRKKRGGREKGIKYTRRTNKFHAIPFHVKTRIKKRKAGTIEIKAGYERGGDFIILHRGKRNTLAKESIIGQREIRGSKRIEPNKRGILLSPDAVGKENISPEDPKSMYTAPRTEPSQILRFKGPKLDS